MNTMTARRVSHKPVVRHYDEFGAPLRRVNVSDADRAEAAAMLNANANDFDVVSAAPTAIVKAATVKAARKPIFEHRRITDELYSPIENPWGYKAELAYVGWTEAATVD